MTDRKTGYPSVDKPWLKYYSEKAKTPTVTECSLYEYLEKNNKEYPLDIAINYLGRKITYKSFLKILIKLQQHF